MIKETLDSQARNWQWLRKLNFWRVWELELQLARLNVESGLLLETRDRKRLPCSSKNTQVPTSMKGNGGEKPMPTLHEAPALWTAMDIEEILGKKLSQIAWLLHESLIFPNSSYSNNLLNTIIFIYRLDQRHQVKTRTKPQKH